MSKGDHRRPASVDIEQFAKNWEAIFGKEKQEADNELRQALERAYVDDVVDQEAGPNIQKEGA